MSESSSESLGSSFVDSGEAFSHLLSRPIPTFGMRQPPLLNGSFGLAPTPPPLSEQIVKCPLCLEPFREPKVLACFHSFCKPCLERQLESSEKIICPQCHMETQLSVHLGIDSLLSDFGLENVLSRQLSLEDKGLIFGSPSSTSSSPPLSDSPPMDANSNHSAGSATGGGRACTGCKSGERASAVCQDCAHYLCANCTMAHQYMHCFEGHRVEQLQPLEPRSLGGSSSNSCKCLQHRNQPLRFFCLTCNLAICSECTLVDHQAPTHQYSDINEVADVQLAGIESLVNEARGKQGELLDMFKSVDAAQTRLNTALGRAHAVLDENIQNVIRVLEDQRKLIAKDIETMYSQKQLRLTMVDKRIQQMSEKLGQTIEFTTRLIKNASPTEVMVFKQLLDTRLQMFLVFNPDMGNILLSPCEIELPSLSPNAARQKLAGVLGTLKQDADWTPAISSSLSGMPPTPIGRPPSRQLNNDVRPFIPAETLGVEILGRTPPTGSSSYSESLSIMRTKPSSPSDFVGSAPSIGPFGSADTNSYSQYEKWSSALEPSLASLDINDLNDIDKANAFCPPRSQIKRQKMIYHCKFGEFGVMEGQFTEPSGVAVNAQNDIVVADTNNHRIQVFDKEGRFKFQFGECGKRDGQLLYPNRVAVNKLTGDFVVTERSPTHQIQVYNQYGQFLRKFGANILQHPRGVCVDSKGRIIVVECKVMRVIIFDMFGNILQKFSCSRYLEFPNGVCTNEKNEILISDNRAHCIKVFSYEGQFLRQIGGEGITNYPIGVGINSQGEVVVADNHNNFNLTVFSQDGTMMGALESKVKHAQCFDVALVDDGSVVLASKDYRLYLYRFHSVNQ